jgi:iron complex outermembrane receptor protein
VAFNRWLCLALVATLCWGNLVVAQETTGRMEGQVIKDDEGVGGVVVLVNELKLTEVTDVDGKFAFDAVPAGTYTLILTLGNNTLTRSVIVTADRTMQLELEVDWDLGIQEKVTVTAAARAAKIVDAPAAVTAIPEEKIERQASTGQVPKVLEFTPGAEVTQSGLYDFNFNTRGFNSSLNRRVSTYIDGRDVGVVLLGAQEWAAIAGGLDDVANLEFIRGPSAALYGANASSGVINITTKSPRDTMGGMLRLTGGIINTLTPDDSTRQAESASEGDSALDFRQAGQLGSGWYYKFTAGARNSGDYTVSRDPDVVDYPEYYIIEGPPPERTEFCELIGETDCLPEEKPLFREQDNEIRYGSARLDKYMGGGGTVMTFEAGLSDIKGPVFQTGIGRVQGLDARRPFFRFNYATEHWSVLGHYAEREGNQANLTKALLKNFELLTDTKRYGVEAQGNWLFADDKVRFVIGAAHTEERVDTTNPATGKQTVVYEKIDANRQAVFSQVDWTVSPQVKLVFAGRVDASTLHDTQFSPKVALVYSINPKNSLRFTYNEAFQVANYSEFFLHARLAAFPLGGFVTLWCESVALEQPIDCDAIDVDEQGFVPILAVGNDDLALEQTQAWEVGYSGLIANRVFITADYYSAKNEDFITDLVPQVSTILGNTEGCVDAEGNPEDDPLQCPINTDYLPWVGPDDWENTALVDPITGSRRIAADALRSSVRLSVGGEDLGFRLAQDLDGSTVVVGRTYTNVGQVDTQGVDFGIQYFVNEALSLQGSYSWFDFEIIDSELSALEDPKCDLAFGEPNRPKTGCLADVLLPNSPENKASLAISYVKPRWSVSLGGRWGAGFRWSAGVLQGEVADYGTADLGGSYSFNEMFTVGLNISNLTDNVHRQTFGGALLYRRFLANTTIRW